MFNYFDIFGEDKFETMVYPACEYKLLKMTHSFKQKTQACQIYITQIDILLKCSHHC